MRRSLIPLLAAACALPGALQAQHATLAGAHRVQRGDTTVLVLRFDGAPGVHVSEPFHLGDRVRLHVDVDQATSRTDSATFARLEGGNLLAFAPRPRAGGIALVVDVRELADYRVARSDSTLELRLLASAPALAAAPATVPQVAAEPPRRALPDAPIILLGTTVPAALLLLAFRRRRGATPLAVAQAHPAAAGPLPQTSPEPSAKVRADGRLWAVRTLSASGASTADVVRRTGMPRDAIRFLEADHPAESAASGTNYRPQTAPTPRQAQH